MNSTYLGYLLTIVSAAAFASTSLFLKLALGTGMSVWSYSLLSSAFTLVMAGWMLLREPRRQRSSTAGLRGWVGLFTLCGAGAVIAFNVSLVYLSISLGTILLFTYPAFVALGAWLLLGQHPSRTHVIALLMTVAGAILTANMTDAAAEGMSLLGIALALLAAVSHATYMVAGERVSVALTAVAATALTRLGILVGTVLLAPRVFLEIPSVTWQGWMIALAASVVAGVAPFLFLNRGIALIGANRTAIASVAELPIALALGMLFQGDVITPIQWAGAALIVAAVIVSQRQTTVEEESPHGSGSGAT